VLGNVFDAISLGKWIYDWTVHWYGRLKMSEIAGDLWEQLIRLVDMTKRAEEGLSQLQRRNHRELIEDGQRLWQRFNSLLRVCEGYVFEEMRRYSSGKIMPMGQESARAFVDTIFGRDRELKRTKKLIRDIRLWSGRFEVKWNDILLNA